jgi:hypothetical protein
VTLRRASAPHFPGAGARHGLRSAPTVYPIGNNPMRRVHSAGDRLSLWHTAPEWIGPLGNRLDAETKVRRLGSVHERIPMVTPDEQCAFSKSFRSILMSFVV